MVTVVITIEAAKEIKSLPRSMKGRIDDLLGSLMKWPNVSGAKPLRGKLKGHFRKRTGTFRVIFRVEGDRLIVVKAGNRKDVYEG
ncbi:MAG: hypothetical protein WC058_14480 [Phycisphaeraceae bacterium]